MNIFTIELTSEYAGWNRCNVRIMCELQDASGNRTGFASTAEKDDSGCCRMTTMPCERVRAFIYVIPESLPADRTVGNQPDFEALLRVRCGERLIADERIEVNRWGGSSTECMADSKGLIRE